MNPTLYHEEIGTIIIASERTYQAAKIFWEAIAEQYEPKPAVPLTPEIEERIASIIAKHKPDAREENLARSAIPGDELPPKNEINCKCALPKPVKEKKPKGKRGGNHSKGNKYGIPSLLWKTDKKRYQILWSRCEKHGITYEEAVKRDGIKSKGGRPSKKAPESPATEPSKNAPLGSAGLKVREWLKVVNGPITPGITVKHNGPKASPFFGKVGTITKVGDGNQVLVNFGESSTWLPQSCIFVVKEAAP